MQRLSRLDGLRGVLAIYIMIGHALPFTLVPGWIASPFHHGEAAVDIFFSLSGLVIYTSLERFNDEFWPFIGGRARRLLPVYFAVLAFAILTICLVSPLRWMPWLPPTSYAALFWTAPSQFIWHIIAHATMLHGLIPQGVLPWAWITILGPAWSLSTEWQFYIVMGLILPGMTSSRRLTHFAYFMLLLGVCYHGLMPLFLPFWQFSRAFLPDAAPYFALGLASAVWMRNRDPIPFLVCLAAVFVLGLFSGAPSRAFIPVGWTIVLLAQRNPRMLLLPKLLDSSLAQFLGLISYPLYLINEPMQRACAILIAPLTHGSAKLFTILWLPAALITPVVSAIVIHRWIEAPFMKPSAWNNSGYFGFTLRRSMARGPGLPEPPTL